MNKRILQAEGLFTIVLSSYLYFFHFQYSWWLFLLLLFVPDVSMIGYLKDSKLGAIGYNLFHTYTIPIILLILGTILQQDTLTMVGLIWAAHIGIDRTFALGLKYPTEFKDTHFNRI